jgi:hypothetical protein
LVRDNTLEVPIAASRFRWWRRVDSADAAACVFGPSQPHRKGEPTFADIVVEKLCHHDPAGLSLIAWRGRSRGAG